MNDLTWEDVVNFIVQNSDNEEMMDKLNKITYPFTSRYKDNYKLNKPVKHYKLEDLEEEVNKPFNYIPC